MRIKHHISGLYKKILTPIGVLVFLVVGVVFVYGINTWDSGYRVYHNNTFVSVQGGNNGALTKRVKSTCTVGDSIFIPTSGYAEWDGPNGFLNKKPSCVTIGCKTNSECGGGEICQGYVASVFTCQGTTYDPNTACARSSLTGNFGSVNIEQYFCQLLSTGGPIRAKYSIYATGNFGYPGYVIGLQTGSSTSSWEKDNCYLDHVNLCQKFTKYANSTKYNITLSQHIAQYSLSTTQCGHGSYGVVSNYPINNTYGSILSHIECTLPTSSDPVSCSTITSPSVCSASAGCTSVTVPETIGTCVPCDPNSWSAWSTCSATCGGGTQTRTNQCGTVQSQNCNIHMCGPFPGKLTNISLAAQWRCLWSNNDMTTPAGYTEIGTYCPTCGTNAYCDATFGKARERISKKLEYTSPYQGDVCVIEGTLSGPSFGYYTYTYQKGTINSVGTCIATSQSKSFTAPLNPHDIEYHNTSYYPY